MASAPTVPAAPPRTLDEAGAGDESDRSARIIVLAGVWFALVVGLVEAAILTVRRFVLDEAIGLSQHFAWMAPVGYVLVFVPPVLVLALIASRWKPLRLEHVAGLLAFLCTLGVLVMFPRVHRIAMVLLALGVGVQTFRVVRSRTGGFVRLVRLSLPVLAGIVVLAAAGVTGALRLREARAAAALPAASTGVPNVLLIILDTVRSASLSLYGYQRPTTPYLERFAQRSTVFDRALSPSPWTLPAHATMFTGRYPHEITADWKVPLDDGDPTLAEVLASIGYATGGFAANPYYTSWEHGLDRGFVHYEDYPVSLGQTVNSASLPAYVFASRAGFTHNIFRRALHNFEYFGRRKADDINRGFLDWLDDVGDRPFFAFLNYVDAHVPYTPPKEYARRFDVRAAPPLLDRITGRYETLTEAEREAGDYDGNRYDATIAFMDEQIRLLIEELEARGVLDNTLVIIASDHGEHLGEHGIYGHANSLYAQLLHVPLLISLPGRVPEGERVSEFVSLRSIPATVLDLIGADGAARLPGVSLAPLWSDDDSARDPLLASVKQGINVREDLPIAEGDLHGVTDAGAHYIRNPDGSEELFDLVSDPDGERDLAPVDRSRLQRTRELLDRLMQTYPPVNGPDADRRD